MASLRWDDLAAPAPDLAGDDIVMTSSPSRGNALAENVVSARLRADPAVSLWSAAVFNPTFALKGGGGPLVNEPYGRTVARVDRDARLPPPTHVGGCHQACHQT